MGDSLSVKGVALFKASVSFYRGTTPTLARKWLVLRLLSTTCGESVTIVERIAFKRTPFSKTGFLCLLVLVKVLHYGKFLLMIGRLWEHRMQFLKGRCEDDFNQWPLVEMTLTFLRLSMPIQSGLRLIRKCVCGFSSFCLRVGGFAGYVWLLILFYAYVCWQGRSFISILMLTTLGLSKAKANVSPIFRRALFCLLGSIILYGFFSHSAMGLKQPLCASGVTIGDWLRRWESTRRVQGKDHDRIANSSRVIHLGGSGSFRRGTILIPCACIGCSSPC